MQPHHAVAHCFHLAAVMLLASILSFSMLSLLSGSIAHQQAGETAFPEDILASHAAGASQTHTLLRETPPNVGGRLPLPP